MKYILINLVCFAMLTFTFSLHCEDKTEKEETETFEPDWDKTIREIEADAHIHDTWN